MIDLTFYQPVGMDNYRRVVYVLIIILLSFLNVTLLSRALNRRFWRKPGGRDARYQTIPMTRKGMLLYGLLVVVTAALIILPIHAVQRYIIQPGLRRCREQQAMREAAVEDIAVS